MSSIKERIKEIAVFKGISYEEFFSKLEVAPTNFRGSKLKTGVNSDLIEKIVTLFPDINSEWIITGKGEKTAVPNILNDPKANYSKEGLLESLQKEIERLKQSISNHESRLTDVEDIVLPDIKENKISFQIGEEGGQLEEDIEKIAKKRGGSDKKG